MTIYFTSDLHFGHKLVAKIRGFGDDALAPGMHDDHIMSMWGSTVKPADVVWVLGDLSVGHREEAKALEILKQLPGKKHLVFGNHDSGHPMHSDAQKSFAKYLDVFETVSSVAHIKSNKQKIILSHFPYNGEGDRPGERYPEWRVRDMGTTPLIHGHTHSSTKYSLSDMGTPQLHVGLDAWDLELVHEKYVHDWVREALGF